MDDGDAVALIDSDFPDDTLPEKPANVVQVVAQIHWKLRDKMFRSSIMATHFGPYYVNLPAQ